MAVDPDPDILPQPSETLQFQLVGLLVAVAVNCEVLPEQSGDAGLAVIVGVPGFGLIVNV